MLSQNVAKVTVPSYYMIRTNLPHRKPQNQWEGVYYFSGLTKRQRHLLLLQRKHARIEAMRSFDADRSQVYQVWNSLAQSGGCSASYSSLEEAFSSMGPSGEPLGSNSYQCGTFFRLVCQLAHHGLHQEAGLAMQSFKSAMEEGDRKDGRLHVSHFSTLLQHMPAQRLGLCLRDSDANGDPALIYKLLGDRGGEERANEAYEIFEEGLSYLSKRSSGPSYVSSAATQLVNNLMETLLTCGYRHVKAVPNTIYDRMGTLGIPPTATTYEHVLTGLALIGDMHSAEAVHCFLSRHHDQHQSIRSYDAMLLGYREAKAYDKCDQLWQQLVDRRWPRAAVSTAELYLRSIVDHSLTPVSEPLQRFGELNVVEKKKIPLVLSQMEDLGVPRSALSRPLQDEIEDALRKFSIHQDKFYEWGRAIKQFDFIEFRRRHGWMYDLHLMKNTTKMMPPVRDPTKPDATLVAAAMAELPAFFNEKFMWEKDALEDLLFVQSEKERVDDVRSGDIYYDENRSIHERSPTWMNEVPETRYDHLYGVSHPDISKMGIRRHLQVEYVNKRELLAKDAALMRKALTRGRRLRHRSELFRSHRQAGTAIPSSES